MKTARQFKVTTAASICLVIALTGRLARADDLADEADLQFQLGIECFDRHDYKCSLEHFLACNRLVFNRNVVFNIAHTYELMRAWPDAYRWYTEALEAEQDPAARTKIEEALKRVEPFVAVVKVETSPPGATLYVDRKDLGPRGSSPRVLAFPAGTYRFIAELEGYEPATSAPVQLELGHTTSVKLELVRIVGTVVAQGSPAGATVRASDIAQSPSCPLPCSLVIPPGHHTLIADQPGFQTSTLTVDLTSGASTTAVFQLQPLLGALLVNTDERGAQVDVDGEVRGFTPVVLSIPVGQRKVRVSMPGFVPLEQTVEIRPSEQAKLDLQLVQLDEVMAASRTNESVDDAPSSVSLIPSREIRGMAYPNLAEAMSGTRGVFVDDDHNYASIGFRGLNPPGSYGNHVLVLLDGHAMNDDWLGSSYVGYDSRTDLDDIDRIEVVRGPGSVLYGTNAFSGVINEVSRGRTAPAGTTFGFSTNDYGLYRAHLSDSIRGDDMGAWVSLAGGIATGRDVYTFPEYVGSNQPNDPPNDGNSVNADAAKMGTATLYAWWKWLTAEGQWQVRDKVSPTGVSGSYLSDASTVFEDSRGFFELRAEPQLSKAVQLVARTSLDYYGNRSTLDAPEALGGLNKETFDGAWLDAELRLVLAPVPQLRLMVGVDGQEHFRVVQTYAEISPTPTPYPTESVPFQVGAAYGLVDWRPWEWIHLSAGLRLDAYSTFGSSLNPRLAIITRPYRGGVLKLMAGTAFRAPSIYELFYNAGTIPDCTPQSLSGCGLKPETIRSGELELTHHFTPEISGVISGYANDIHDLMQLRPATIDGTAYAYSNAPVPTLSLGAEVEVRREWRQGWMVEANYAYQHSSYQEPAGIDPSQALRQVPNSPAHVAGLKFAVPLVPRLALLSNRVSAVGPRYDINDHPDDLLQQQTGWALVDDVVLTGDVDEWHAHYSLGIYNLADWRYQVPVSIDFSPVDLIIQNGRTFLASASVSF